MMVTVMVMATADRLRQILDVGKLAGFRCVGEVRGELVELIGGGRVAVVARGLRGGLEVGRNLTGKLLILSRIRLLELLERAQHLGQRRELAVVRG
jgi:hypothetical protein